jgi:hypothetical protein
MSSGGTFMKFAALALVALAALILGAPLTTSTAVAAPALAGASVPAQEQLKSDFVEPAQYYYRRYHRRRYVCWYRRGYYGVRRVCGWRYY